MFQLHSIRYLIQKYKCVPTRPKREKERDARAYVLGSNRGEKCACFLASRQVEKRVGQAAVEYTVFKYHIRP